MGTGTASCRASPHFFLHFCLNFCNLIFHDLTSPFYTRRGGPNPSRVQENHGMPLTQQQLTALAFDPTLLFTYRAWKPDRWQRELLRSNAPRILLNCCRQAGKSTAVAALALHTALFQTGSLILLVSRSQ